VEPHFLGFSDNLTAIAHLCELVEEFGWERGEEVYCNLGAKLIARGRPEPERFRRTAIETMASMATTMAGVAAGGDGKFDEDGFTRSLVSPDVVEAFTAVEQVLQAGVELDRVATTLVLLAADRMARTPVDVNAGWPELTTELHLATSLRTALRYGGPTVAAKSLFHCVFQVFQDRWLNVPYRPLGGPREGGDLDAANEGEAISAITDSIQALDVHKVGPQVQGYLEAGYDGGTLLHEMGKVILKDDTGQTILPTLRAAFDEWGRVEDHPARNQLLVGLARYAADIRRNKNSRGFVQTAVRFATGRPTVDVFES
jgi:hypothetical protein